VPSTVNMHIGLLGSGNISDTHARAAAAIPGVTVAAVCGSTRVRAARLADRYGAAAYDDLTRFLAHRPLDIVAIGTPSGLHAAQATAALQQGFHVIVEKPIDISTDRVDALIEAADRAGLTLGVFFQDRLKPDFVALKSLLDRGGLGTPVLASAHVRWYRDASYYADSRWRGTWALDGGGALMNQGIHAVDALQWLCGPVSSVMAATATRLHAIEVEDTVAATLTFESGALGVIQASTAVFPGYARRLEMTGANGTIVLEGDRLVAADLRDASPALHVSVSSASASAASATVADASAHQRILEDFIDAIRSRREPVCSGREGRKSVALVQAIYESARTGRAASPK
jgi:UDP-N-acetyl-2-amino-2-deoxyglucuronate dehydrogenase